MIFILAPYGIRRPRHFYDYKFLGLLRPFDRVDFVCHTALPSRVFSTDRRAAFPEVLEAGRRQLGVPYRVGDIPVSKRGLQGPGVVAAVRQGITPEHMRMGFESELGGLPGPLDRRRKRLPVVV